MLQLEECLDVIVVSEEVGWKKPDPRIFHLAAELLETAVEDCIFIGDHPSNDYFGGREAGMTAIWFEGFRPWLHQTPAEWKIAHLEEIPPVIEAIVTRHALNKPGGRAAEFRAKSTLVKNSMAFQLDQVVPLGRSFEEYVAMFSLTDADLQKRILGCGDGPASFNAESTSKGGTVVSIDPLYECDAEQIRERIEQTVAGVMEQTRRNAEEFVWRHVRSVDELAEVRMGAMQKFLADYPAGRADGRYAAGSLPALDFPGGSLDLGLCSHFLFLYSQHFGLDFHIASIEEMLRVCAEVRIFPLLQLGGEPSPYVDAVIARLQEKKVAVEIVEVPYEFQRGGNKMMRIVQEEAPGNANW